MQLSASTLHYSIILIITLCLCAKRELISLLVKVILKYDFINSSIKGIAAVAVISTFWLFLQNCILTSIVADFEWKTTLWRQTQTDWKLDLFSKRQSAAAKSVSHSNSRPLLIPVWSSCSSGWEAPHMQHVYKWCHTDYCPTSTVTYGTLVLQTLNLHNKKNLTIYNTVLRMLTVYYISATAATFFFFY